MAILAAQRKERIIEIVFERKVVSIDELCNLLGASKATVRRDADELAAQRVVDRVRGGVSVPRPDPKELTVSQRETRNWEYKHAIGQRAAELIEDGDTIFLGSGSTVLEVARHMFQKKDITVITNSIPVVNMLADFSGVEVVVTGGYLRTDELSLIGHVVRKSLEEFRADKVIMGIQGVDAEKGLTNDYLPESLTDRTIVDFASKLIVVADHSKFRQVNASFVCGIARVTVIVTDDQVEQATLNAIKSQGPEIMIAQTGSVL